MRKEKAPAWVYGTLLVESERENRRRRGVNPWWLLLALAMALAVCLLPRC